MFSISSLFSGATIISSKGSSVTVLSLFDLFTASAISFPKTFPVLWTTFLEAIFKE